MRRTKVITGNREVYEKFNMLHYSPEIIIKDFDKNRIRQIVDNINRNNKCLELSKIDDYFIIKKINNVNFDVYLKV